MQRVVITGMHARITSVSGRFAATNYERSSGKESGELGSGSQARGGRKISERCEFDGSWGDCESRVPKRRGTSGESITSTLKRAWHAQLHIASWCTEPAESGSVLLPDPDPEWLSPHVDAQRVSAGGQQLSPAQPVKAGTRAIANSTRISFLPIMTFTIT